MLFYFIFGTLLVIFPKEVVSRPYERPGWTKRMKIMRAFGLVIMFTWFLSVILTPLRIGNLVIIGGSIDALGLTMFVIALFNYRDTPLDRPVTKGLYNI